MAKNNFEAVLLAAGQDKAIPLSATLELADASVLIVMEATGDHNPQLAERLLAERPEALIAIVNPAFIKKGFDRSLGSRNKTDRTDCAMLLQICTGRPVLSFCTSCCPNSSRRRDIFWQHWLMSLCSVLAERVPWRSLQWERGRLAREHGAPQRLAAFREGGKAVGQEQSR